MSKEYRKKPVVVEVIQYTGQNDFEIQEWSRTNNGNRRIITSPILEPTKKNPTGSYLQIYTLEGVMTAIVGDWIIKGIKGEFYPCKPDIFEQTYEPVKPSPSPAKDKCPRCKGTGREVHHEGSVWETFSDCSLCKASQPAMPLIASPYENSEDKSFFHKSIELAFLEGSRKQRDADMAWHKNRTLDDIIGANTGFSLEAHDQQVRKEAITEFAEECIKTLPEQDAYKKGVEDGGEWVSGYEAAIKTVIAHIRAMAGE